MKKQKISEPRFIAVGTLSLASIEKLNPADLVQFTKDQIDVACRAGLNYLKFPKRHLTQSQYDEIDDYCREREIGWFAAVWDEESIDAMRRFTTKLPNGTWGLMMEVPAELSYDLDFVQKVRDSSDFLIINTELSSQEEIDSVIHTCSPDVVIHTGTSDLIYITYLRHCCVVDFQSTFRVGHSSVDADPIITALAASSGATWFDYPSGDPQILTLVSKLRFTYEALTGYGIKTLSKSAKARRKA